MTQSTDVFVAGGGPAGLAVAIAAAQRGMTVTVADSSRPPIDKACGEGIMPDGLAALRRSWSGSEWIHRSSLSGSSIRGRRR